VEIRVATLQCGVGIVGIIPGQAIRESQRFGAIGRGGELQQPALTRRRAIEMPDRTLNHIIDGVRRNLPA